ncbi:MAG: hypothetical protein Q8Q25_00400 [bacterium]|nr:hypothetical protein [bacterium]
MATRIVFTNFLGLSYFLTKYKPNQGNIDKASLERDFSPCTISRSFADALKSNAQGELLRGSIAYLQKRAQEITASARDSLVLTQECAAELEAGMKQKGGAMGRSTVPFLFSVQAVLENLARKKIPLVVKARERCASCTRVMQTENIPYRFNPESRQFEVVGGVSPDEPAFVVVGDQFDGNLETFEQIKKELPKPCACTRPISLQGKDIAEIILANAAAHKQFTTAKNAEEIPIQFEGLPNLGSEYERLKRVAENGMSMATMKTFFIDHVKPDTVGRALGI